MRQAFDEMKGPTARCGRPIRNWPNWLGEVPPDVLDYRRREAELSVPAHRHHLRGLWRGRSHERLIPFDVIPRILAATNGTRCAAGSSSASGRSTPILRDIYGRREILKAGIVPEDLVFQNPVFRPEMNGQKVPHDIYVHVAGIDVVRVDADTFYVLEDNARTPSGVSYMLENREIMMRLFPGAVLAPPRRAGRELSGRAAGHAEIGGAGLGVRRSDRRAAHARRLQLGLLRALVPGRQARRRAGRGPRPVREGRYRLHAHHAGPQAGRRDLPPHRRRFPRSADVPAGHRARRGRADVGLPGRQRHARQRGRHRHRRRQGDLQLHAATS